jgi:hypothetical protein
MPDFPLFAAKLVSAIATQLNKWQIATTPYFLQLQTKKLMETTCTKD